MGYRDDGEQGHRGDDDRGYRGDDEGRHRGNEDRGYRGDDEGRHHGDEDRGHRGDDDHGDHGSHGHRGDAWDEVCTNRGKVYRDCQVLSHDDYGITFRHRNGAAREAFCDLPNSLQQHYNYDRGAADQYVKRHTSVPANRSRGTSRRRVARNFDGFSPQYAATRAHLAFAGGLLGTPFGGSLGLPGVASFDAWQTNHRFAQYNPYHSSHSWKVQDGNVYLNNRRQSNRYDCAVSYGHAYRPQYNPYSYLNRARYGNPIAPPMNGGHIRATNGGNPIAPAMMSYSQLQSSRVSAARRAARSGGGRRH